MGLKLEYRLEFIIVAIIIFSLLAVFVRLRYVAVSRSNRLFFHFIIMALITSVIDLAVNVIEPLAVDGHIPARLAIATRSVFSSLSGFIIYEAFLYMNSFNKARKNNSYAERTVLILAFVNAAINMANVVWPFMYITVGNVIQENRKLTFFRQIVPLIIVVIVFVFIVKYIKQFEKSKTIYICILPVIIVIGVICEMLAGTVIKSIDKYLLAYLFVSLGCAISMFGLESPDMKRLSEGLDELEKSKEEAEKARNEAEKANELMSTFLMRMSHEIRTPVNGILGMNELILRDSDEPEIENYAVDIKSAAESLISIIDDVLDFSKIESGDIELNPTEYDLATLVKNLWNLFSLKAKDLKLTLDFEVDKELPSKLYGDDVRIRQIITNLLSNAIKYTEKGNVTLRISGEKLEDSKLCLKISVTDTGRGLKEEALATLTDAFTRYELQDNRNIEGTGLGLAIVSRLLKLMDSELKVDSTYGKGSCFSFEVVQTIMDETPIGDYRRSKRRPEESSVKTQESHENSAASVLVVDDNKINRKVFVGILKDTGVEVLEAEGGLECLEICKTKKFNAIFMDHFMPEPDGVETFRRLRANINGLNAYTPVICLTANAIRGAREEYLAMGFNDAIFKPVSSAALHEIVEKYI